MGRADDVVKVAGNRIGTAEVESALVSHEAVVEAAVIGKPHPTAGEQIKAFVILKQGQQETPDLIKSLQDHVLEELGKIAVPGKLRLFPHFPKPVPAKSCVESSKPKNSAKIPEIFQHWRNKSLPLSIHSLTNPFNMAP
ncbi:MAG: hypothetical protein MRJ67_12175 [Nitrospirales bacterium]|nr:hypothetical protein [Nitrospirales bacterium]